MGIRDGSWIDFAFSAAFALSVAVSSGIADLVIYGINFSDVLYTNGPFAVDVASAISIAAITWSLFLGIPKFGSLATEKLAAIGLTFVVIAVGMIDPGFASGSPEIGLVALGVTSAGYWTLYYEGM